MTPPHVACHEGLVTDADVDACGPDLGPRVNPVKHFVLLHTRQLRSTIRHMHTR
jgi:hypothetical protein